jgi:hypothetical protein
MKYLHTGYILFCDEAEHAENGRVNAEGLFDLFVGKSLPLKTKCYMIVGFGTPYERRQYKGVITIENPNGEVVFSKEFNANDPSDIYKGHYVVKPDIVLNQEGMWNAKVILKNWKEDPMWDIERKFWVMVEGDSPPDP